jgi:hypothetical protein
MPQDPRLKHGQPINPKDPDSPRNINIIEGTKNDKTISGRGGYPIRPRNYDDPMDLASWYLMGDGVNDFWEREELANAKVIGEYKKKQKEEQRRKMLSNERDYDGRTAEFGKTALGGTQSNSVKKDDRYRRGMNIKK